MSGWCSLFFGMLPGRPRREIEALAKTIAHQARQSVHPSVEVDGTAVALCAALVWCVREIEGVKDGRRGA